MQDQHQDRHHGGGQKQDGTLQGEVHEAGDEIDAMYRSRSDLHVDLLLHEQVLRGMHE